MASKPSCGIVARSRDSLLQALHDCCVLEDALSGVYSFGV